MAHRRSPQAQAWPACRRRVLRSLPGPFLFPFAVRRSMLRFDRRLVSAVPSECSPTAERSQTLAGGRSAASTAGKRVSNRGDPGRGSAAKAAMRAPPMRMIATSLSVIEGHAGRPGALVESWAIVAFANASDSAAPKSEMHSQSRSVWIVNVWQPRTNSPFSGWENSAPGRPSANTPPFDSMRLANTDARDSRRPATLCG